MLRIKEAITAAKTAGRKITKKQLAQRIWPDSSVHVAQINMSNLCMGRTKYVPPQWIKIICEECGCSADFLLGID